MLATSDPNEVIGWLAIFGLILVALWRFVLWLRDLPVKPDPWDAEITQKLDEPDAVEVCHRCLTPVRPNAWFCQHCGSAVGPYNNLMPPICYFSEGEVFRNGLHDRFRSRPFIVFGYVFLSLAAYSVFAPIYWLFLLRHLKRPCSRPKPEETAV